MIKINEVVIVEGKYDKIKLSSIIDAIIIQTDGFSIFKDKEKIELLKNLAEKKGLLIITDSDTAGFKIRNFLKGMIDKKNIKNAYIPDVYGKEKRKTVLSKEGKLGVEGIENEEIIRAINNANVTTFEVDEKNMITKSDLYELHITGHQNSTVIRKNILKRLNLPEHISSNMLLDILNITLSLDELKNIIKETQSEI